jgi:serine/threonine protein kinase
MPPLLPLDGILRARYKIAKVIWETILVNIYYVRDLHMPEKSWIVREMQMIAVDNSDRSKIIRNFNNEAQRISSVNHPYIATVVDFFSEGTNFYVVREYIPGTDLVTLLKKNQKPFNETDVIGWAIQIAEALSFLYSSKFPALFFREFSMQNIIVMNNGGIKLIDLGLAGCFQTESATEGLSRMGSMDYAPPEQFSEEGFFDIRSLVYSLGAFMYHCLTNVNPASSPFDLKPMNILNPVLTSGIQDVVNKATQNNPEMRYQNLNDIRRDLVALLKAPKLSPVKIEKDKENESSLLNWILGILLTITMGVILFLIYHYFLKP